MSLADADRVRSLSGVVEGGSNESVPASYLIWWYEQRFEGAGLNELRTKRDDALLDYVSDHLEQLEDEREEE